MSAGTQAMDAQRLYDARSSKYDESWHPRFASHMVQLVGPQPGESVLDLACGTGLVTFLASEAVGEEGRVVGVDVSEGMLNEARRKFQDHSLHDVGFFKHDITDLDNLEEIQMIKSKFNLITCTSALVLLPDPASTLKSWTEYLAPGGRLIVDVTHPRNQIVGITMERVGRRLRRPVPHYRLNFQTENDLIEMMEKAGLKDIKLWRLSQLPIEGTTELKDYVFDPHKPRLEKVYDVQDADAVFEKAMSGSETYACLQGVKEQARSFFREEWTKLADDDGKVVSYDCVYVAIGWNEHSVSEYSAGFTASEYSEGDSRLV